MTTVYLDHVKKRFEELDLVEPDAVKPCTEDEVNALEQQVGLSLPRAYREFLLWMGHGAGKFMRGSDFFYQDLPLQEAAMELLKENNFPEALPERAFVLLMHQGYQFDFFHTSEGDDPPIYYFSEGVEQTSFIQISESFSEFLLAEIEAHAEHLEGMKQRKKNRDNQDDA